MYVLGTKASMHVRRETVEEDFCIYREPLYRGVGSMAHRNSIKFLKLKSINDNQSVGNEYQPLAGLRYQLLCTHLGI